MNCNYGQGFYFHRPMSVEAAEELIQTIPIENFRAAHEQVSRIRNVCEALPDSPEMWKLGDNIFRILYIDTNSRSLLEEEFCCIQSHPVIGCSLLREAGYEEHLAPAALYHHCFYNGQGGYPRDVPPCPQDIKGIVDVLTVAEIGRAHV